MRHFIHHDFYSHSADRRQFSTLSHQSEARDIGHGMHGRQFARASSGFQLLC